MYRVRPKPAATMETELCPAMLFAVKSGCTCLKQGESWPAVCFLVRSGGPVSAFTVLKAPRAADGQHRRITQATERLTLHQSSGGRDPAGLKPAIGRTRAVPRAHLNRNTQRVQPGQPAPPPTDRALQGKNGITRTEPTARANRDRLQRRPVNAAARDVSLKKTTSGGRRRRSVGARAINRAPNAAARSPESKREPKSYGDNPQTGVPKGFLPGRNVRSKCR
jgi:hypothetical protein